MAIAAEAKVGKRLFNVDEYYRMAEFGILRPEDRIELIEGEIVEMVPIGDHHNSAVLYLNNKLSAALAGRAIVSSQGPTRLSFISEPVPDIMILKYRPDFYRSGLPKPEDVLLVIEISHTSLNYDRKTKANLYAKHGISEYWIVNLNERQIEVYRDIRGERYGEISVVMEDGTVSPPAFPEIILSVKEIVEPNA